MEWLKQLGTIAALWLWRISSVWLLASDPCNNNRAAYTERVHSNLSPGATQDDVETRRESTRVTHGRFSARCSHWFHLKFKLMMRGVSPGPVSSQKWVLIKTGHVFGRPGKWCVRLYAVRIEAIGWRQRPIMMSWQKASMLLATPKKHKMRVGQTFTWLIQDQMPRVA